MCFNYLRISGSNEAISSENRYGGLLTTADTEPQRLSTDSASDKTQSKTVYKQFRRII